MTTSGRATRASQRISSSSPGNKTILTVRSLLTSMVNERQPPGPVNWPSGGTMTRQLKYGSSQLYGWIKNSGFPSAVTGTETSNFLRISLPFRRAQSL